MLGGVYVVLIVAMILAEAAYTPAGAIGEVLRSPSIRYVLKLSLISCKITAIVCLWVARPLAYLMSRFEFPGKTAIDAIVDIPIVLPPLVVGLCLLILFQAPPLKQLGITYAVPSVNGQTCGLGLRPRFFGVMFISRRSCRKKIHSQDWSFRQNSGRNRPAASEV